MRLATSTAAAVVIVFATALSHGQAPAPGSTGVAPTEMVPLEDETPRAWFVELASPPASDGTSRLTLEREEASFHSAAARAGIHYSESRHFRDLWNGVTVETDLAGANSLRGLPGVNAIYPVVSARRAQQEGTPGNETEMITALAMTGADVAQSELGLTGRHVRVAIMDSGIDYDHPDLGGCFGRGCRVAKGWDFVGDDFNPDPASPAYNPVPSPDPLPDDCDGHGTHVAGIVGANGRFHGVAPNVTLFAYRVFGCEGPTTTDVMLAAMERAYADHADILNMSIGSPFGWPQYPTAQGAARLVRKGMIVVASAGNEGANGLYAAAAPSIGRGVVSVASFDNTSINYASFVASPGNRRVGYQPAVGAPPAPLNGGAALARTGTTASTADACVALPAGSLSNRIALVQRGTCTIASKVLNAQAAGAVGVIVYNNVAGRFLTTVAGSPVTVPVVTITNTDGVALDALVQAGTASIAWTADAVSEPQATGNLISSFSSWGPTADLFVKPDLGAPGGRIRSTLPLELGGYGSLSGTSMSSPYTAGAMALLLEAHPRTTPAEALAIMQNQAQPHLWSGNPTLGFLDLVHRQGAGLIAVDRAARAEVIVTPSALALGELESGATVRRTLTLASLQRRGHRGWHRHGRHWHGDDACTAVTYTLGHEPALATGASTFTPTFLTSSATVTFDRQTLGVGDQRGQNHDRDDVTVTVAPPANPAARLFGGYVTLTPDDDGPVLRVPYLGYNGDYQAIVALTPTSAGFPWLAKLVGTSLVNQPSGATFTLAGNDAPFILFHLEHQVSVLRARVLEAATGAFVGDLDRERFVPRNSTATSFFGLIWDGTVTRRHWNTPVAVPNGAYRVELSIVKALGQATNANHVEQWTSPIIGIARPGGGT